MAEYILNIMQYVEINLISMIILFIILFSLEKKKKNNAMNADLAFIGMIRSNIIILIADTAILLLKNHTACLTYFIFQQIFLLCWIIYVIKFLFNNKKISNKIKLLIAVAIITPMLFVIASPITKQIYYLSSDNAYMRGPLIILIAITGYIVFLVSSLIIINKRNKSGQFNSKAPYNNLLAFSTIVLMSNIAQMFLPGLTITWAISAISLLLFFVNDQRYQINNDALTGLYNRKYITNKLEYELEKNKVDKMFIIMGDLDHFKKINDQYGHIVGDRSLINLAKILKKVCTPQIVAARFAGDEFLIVGSVKDETEVQELINKVNELLKEYNESSKEPYALSLSMGYAIYDKTKHSNVDRLISAADKKMYKAKKSRSRRRTL